MIKLLELYPEHLNLNGDRGNLLVLQRRLEWSGVQVTREEHRAGEQLAEQPDFVLIGHGSKAAWRQIYGDLKTISPQLNEWFRSGTQALAVASGHAACTGLIDGFDLAPQRIERISKFEIVDFEGHEVLGYLNTDFDLAVIESKGSVLATQLHGPLFAKNPVLADRVISKMLEPRGLPTTVNQSKFENVAELVTAAWNLEREMI